MLDAEIASVFRKHVLAGRLREARARQGLEDFLNLPILRFAHAALLPRVFDLRATITAYDAIYVVLAESLGATLVTCDERLARAAAGIVTGDVIATIKESIKYIGHFHTAGVPGRNE